MENGGTYQPMGLVEEKRPATICSIRRSVVLLLIYLPLYFVFIAGAAIIFMATEGSVEEEYRRRLLQTRQTFLREHKCVSGECKSWMEILSVKLEFSSQRTSGNWINFRAMNPELYHAILLEY